MPTTNATTGKKALIDLLKAQAAPAGLLDGVEVHYAYNGNVGARSVYGGGWRMTAEDDVAETPGVLVVETVFYSLYVRVLSRPACDVEETDLVADGIATALGAVLKANPRLAGGLSITGIYAGQGDYSRTDDETTSVHGYEVRTTSRLSWG
jgi:hypothetical protein